VTQNRDKEVSVLILNSEHLPIGKLANTRETDRWPTPPRRQ